MTATHQQPKPITPEQAKRILAGFDIWALDSADAIAELVTATAALAPVLAPVLAPLPTTARKARGRRRF